MKGTHAVTVPARDLLRQTQQTEVRDRWLLGWVWPLRDDWPAGARGWHDGSERSEVDVGRRGKGTMGGRMMNEGWEERRSPKDGAVLL